MWGRFFESNTSEQKLAPSATVMTNQRSSLRSQKPYLSGLRSPSSATKARCRFPSESSFNAENFPGAPESTTSIRHSAPNAIGAEHATMPARKTTALTMDFLVLEALIMSLALLVLYLLFPVLHQT